MLCTLGILFIVLGSFRISSYAFKTYESIEKVPYNRVGLLFGTSPLNSDGETNEYFSYRIMAASQLFKAGKIDYILVSGDNQHPSYNEPRLMRKALVKAGVPAERIVFDFAGIRTLDSVVRARKVFLQKSITFISQDFQNERALFIADKYDLKAVGFNAISPERSFISRIGIREFFARIMCVLDVYILDTQPKFLGDPVKIGKSSLPKKLSSKPVKQTSPIKKISDNAQVLAIQKRIAVYEPLAKKTTDSKRILKAALSINNTDVAPANEIVNPEVSIADSMLSTQQNELLSSQKDEALDEAQKQAEESISVRE
nr:ElyC/SanA/YdcF family protein [Succinivibrio faecicola]